MRTIQTVVLLACLLQAGAASARRLAYNLVDEPVHSFDRAVLVADAALRARGFNSQTLAVEGDRLRFGAPPGLTAVPRGEAGGTFARISASLEADLAAGQIKAGDQVLLNLFTHGQPQTAGETGHSVRFGGAVLPVRDLAPVLRRLAARGVRVALLDHSCYSSATLAMDLPGVCVTSAESVGEEAEADNSPHGAFGDSLWRTVQERSPHSLGEAFRQTYALKRQPGAAGWRVNVPGMNSSGNAALRRLLARVEAGTVDMWDPPCEDGNCGFRDASQGLDEFISLSSGLLRARAAEMLPLLRRYRELAAARKALPGFPFALSRADLARSVDWQREMDSLRERVRGMEVDLYELIEASGPGNGPCDSFAL